MEKTAGQSNTKPPLCTFQPKGSSRVCSRYTVKPAVQCVMESLQCAAVSNTQQSSAYIEPSWRQGIVGCRLAVMKGGLCGSVLLRVW